MGWGHNLGECHRPFGIDCWSFDVEGDPVAVAISASTVSAWVEAPDRRYLRTEVVELARLGAANRWANRVMLRLWREVCAPRWTHWPIQAAVSYSDSHHSGDLYRFDGWELWGERRGRSTGGGTWTRRREEGEQVVGPKRLWGWRYEEAA